jgi:hypothetical protein
MAGEKPSSGVYETFDSGDGPTVPDESRSDFANADSKEGLESYCSNQAQVEQGLNPEVPSKKR